MAENFYPLQPQRISLTHLHHCEILFSSIYCLHTPMEKAGRGSALITAATLTTNNSQGRIVMADLKVITNTAYRNYSTQPRRRQYPCEVREDEGSYSSNTEDLLDKMKTLLNLPMWPQFQDGVYLKPEEAARLYRLAHGVRGLIHILNRSVHLRGNAKIYSIGQAIWLSELLESQCWAAAVETGEALAGFSDELQHRTTTLM
jgi:hypothetical protein